MRVLFVTDRMNNRGGADYHFLQVIQWAVDRGHSVTLACGHLSSDILLPAGIEVVRIRGLSSAVDSSARLGTLPALLGASDVVHVQNVMNPTALAMAVAANKTIITIQDHRMFCPGVGKTLPDGSPCTEEMNLDLCSACLPDRTYRDRIVTLTKTRRLALGRAKLLVLSNWMAAQLTSDLHQEVQVLPPWVETGPERNEAGDSFLLGGRLVNHKGILDGWQSWQLAGPPLPLRVAGDGPLLAKIKDAHHLGWLSQEDLMNELRSARALIFPSYWQEPFGILAVQALAQGTPVVVAESGGTSEWSEKGCLRVQPGDVGAMAAAITRLATDPEFALRLGQEGRRFVATRFSRSVIEKKLDDVYNDVIR